MGHDYLLSVTTEALDENLETEIESKIQKVLIQKMDSRDLGLHVHFLKNIEITDTNLLKAFWKLVEPAIKPVRLKSMCLERDSRTKVCIEETE